jgi:hypothetical protein
MSEALSQRGTSITCGHVAFAADVDSRSATAPESLCSTLFMKPIRFLLHDAGTLAVVTGA